MKKNTRKSPKRVLIVLGLLLLLVALFSLTLGRYPISLNELVGIISSQVIFIKPFWDEKMEIIFWNVRLPRIILAILVGSCLSVAGACFQGIFQNPMASPDILGASTGAAFGAALAILNHASKAMISVSAFFFSILCVGIVYLVSQKSMGNKILALVLSGIMVSSLFNAGTSFLKLAADPMDELPAITYWMMGSLSGASVKDIRFVFPLMCIGIFPIILLRWKITVITMGEEEARAMGVNTGLVRLIIIISATLITAASVSVSGMIGWVGLVIPHLSRRLIGSNYKYLIPATILFGAIFLLIVDNVSRNVLTSEIPIGILTAFIGAPFFLYLLSGRGDKL
ncbi:iron complex transport system permease protein [Lachnotalea glycerini]|uniref:Iron ABC transporter permease n=1 Tax=Lachnotalea glycerini TaxID=1763509 RepID=A0A255IT20_9FIRM|nr:iron ABC transporter permease [Lachnotalea glycerini]PXV93433.1 iron complex transport system permease protein [Lachnotalea glycerini]RDY31837.1 iron ABC transporter permease [Lachnotalea glycerini]